MRHFSPKCRIRFRESVFNIRRTRMFHFDSADWETFALDDVAAAAAAKFSEASQTTSLGSTRGGDQRHFFAPVESAATIERGRDVSAAVNVASSRQGWNHG